MDASLWGTILLIVGIGLIIVQVVFSWRAAKAATKAKEKLGSGEEFADFGSFIGDILKELAKTLPFAVAGILLILIGAAIGGLFDVGQWFNPGDGSDPSST